MVIYVIIMLFIGISLLTVGLLVWRKGYLKLIHDFHYKNVQDIKGYREAMGKALSSIGIISLISGLLVLLCKTLILISAVFFCLGLTVLLIVIFKIQKKYNGSIFG